MNTKTLSTRALDTIDQYLHFRIGSGTCSVPYFNNKVTKSRGALRAYVGKGSPHDILEEIQTILVKAHVDTKALSNESLAKFLADNNIGIDCSGFAYYVLNAESEASGRGTLDKHISFINCHGILGKMRCSLRPVENCDVATLADNANSSIISAKDAKPGDIITMLDAGASSANSPRGDRDHILVIHQVEYQNFSAYKLHYSHAVAYPEDGVYGTGIKQGTIEITDPNKPITEQLWTEESGISTQNRLLSRAKNSKTEVRRLR